MPGELKTIHMFYKRVSYATKTQHQPQSQGGGSELWIPGATVGLELEADSSLVHQPDQFNDQISQLFTLARQSVDRELARPPDPIGNGAAPNGTRSRHLRLERLPRRTSSAHFMRLPANLALI